MFQEESGLLLGQLISSGGEDRCLCVKAHEELTSLWLTNKNVKMSSLVVTGKQRCVPGLRGCTVDARGFSGCATALSILSACAEVSPPPDGRSCDVAVVVAGAGRQDDSRFRGFRTITAGLDGRGLVRRVLVAACGCRAAFGALCLYSMLRVYIESAYLSLNVKMI